MKYNVVLQRLAARDLKEAYDWVADRAPFTATKWLERFHKQIQTLQSNPHRCAHARENGKVGLELRELHFGRRPNVFRVIFFVEGNCVRVARIVRAQRRYLTRKQLEEATKPDENRDSGNGEPASPEPG